MTVSTTALLFLFGQTAPGTVGSGELMSRVRGLVNAEFQGADASLKEAFAERICLALLAAPASHSGWLLNDLPHAIEYHAGIVQSASPGVEIPGRNRDEGLPRLPAALIKEGYANEVDFLCTRIRRASRRDQGPVSAIVMQVDAIADELVRTLGERLRGVESDAYVQREVGRLRRSWKESLGTPYNAFLDTPLSPDALSLVLSQTRNAAATFPPTTLTREDLADEERLAALGVLQLMADVREAAYLAGPICYAEYNPFEERAAEWRRKAGTAFERALLSEVTPGAPTPAEGEAIVARARADSSSSSTVIAPAKIASASARPADAQPVGVPRGAILALLAAVFLVVTALLLRRRRPAS